MSLFPGCRNDKYYNEDFLNETDKEYLRGFDYAIECVMDNFFDNLDVHLDSNVREGLEKELMKDQKHEYSFISDVSPDTEVVRQVETHADAIRESMLEAAEMERDELITSMIDNMNNEEYEKLREVALKEHPDKDYRDTCSFTEIAKRGGDI